MQRRVQIVAVLFAWFLTTGAQWDLLQTFGWARMFTSYVKTMSVTAAVKRTFGGEMCGVCEVVNQAKQPEKAAPTLGGKVEVKMILVMKPESDVFVPAIEVIRWVPTPGFALSCGRLAPETPPPRV